MLRHMDAAHNSGTPGTSGRRWAYTGLALGLFVSEAANIAHSFVPPEGAPPGWRPQPGAVLGSMFWPLALFVTLEIQARVVWPEGKRWWAARWLGLTPVASVAAFVSYRHMCGLLTHYGEDWWTAHLGPVAVDGLMVMATAALLATTGVRPARAAASPGDTATDVPDVSTPAPAHVPAAPAPTERHTPDTPVRLTAVPTPKRRAARTGTRAAKPQATVQAAHEAAARLTAQKRAVGRRNLGEELRAAGFSCSNDKADELLAALNTTTTQEA